MTGLGYKDFSCRVALDTNQIMWTLSKFFLPETRHIGQELISDDFIIKVSYVTRLGYKDFFIVEWL